MLFLLKGSRITRASLVACALGAVLHACVAQETTQSYPVHGVVLNSVTHQPIARALVDGHQDAVLTDNDGHFELNLPGGRANIVVRRPGYGSAGQTLSHGVTVAANMPELTFYLTPQATITGHVTLSTGDETDGIRITAYRRQVVNGHERWHMQTFATVNSDGAFRLANLEAPADYLLYTMPAHDSIGAVSPAATGQGYPSVYYPGVTDLAAAGILTLAPGQQAQADFTLTRQPFYPVTIAVPNRERRGMLIQIHDTSGRVVESSARWNPQQGVAQVNLPSGRYYAEARMGGGNSSYGRVDFTVAGAPVTGLTLAMLPMHSIPVEIHKDFTESSGNQPQGIAFSGQPTDMNAGLNLTLSSADGFDSQMGGSGLRHPEGSSDSTLFELENVAPGRYWVETSPFQGYVSSIASGGVDLAREPLNVGPGSTTAPIQITLRNDGGAIAGQINPSAAPESASGAGETPPAYIYAIPLSPTTSHIPQGFSQGSGQFTISNVPPGSYHVVACDQSQQIDPSDPQQLARYTGKGQTVTVEANGTANVQLDLIRSGEEGSAP